MNNENTSRLEQYLQAIADGTGAEGLPVPQSRLEEIFLAIATGDASRCPKPQSRLEALAYACIGRIGSSGGGSSGGGHEIIEYLPTTKALFEFQEAFGAFLAMIPTDEATYTAWATNAEPVTVVYDDDIFTCSVQNIQGDNGVGNMIPFGGTSNGEEFAISVMVNTNGDGSKLYFFMVGSTVDTEPTEHTVRVYRVFGGEAEG